MLAVQGVTSESSVRGLGADRGRPGSCHRFVLAQKGRRRGYDGPSLRGTQLRLVRSVAVPPRTVVAGSV